MSYCSIAFGVTGRRATTYVLASSVLLASCSLGFSDMPSSPANPSLPTARSSDLPPLSVPFQRVKAAAALEGTGDQIIADLAVAGPRLVAVGQVVANGTLQRRPVVWATADGHTWERVEVPAADHEQEMEAVTEYAGGLIAVGSAQIGSTFTGAVWASNDGTEWREVSAPALTDGSVVLRDVLMWRDRLVAVGSRNGAAGVWLSQDGADWQRAPDQDAFRTPSGGLAMMTRVATNGDDLIAVGSVDAGPESGGSDAAVWTSSDGVEWSRVDAASLGGPSFEEAMGIVSSADGIAVLGRSVTDDVESTATVWQSADLVRWSREEIGGKGDESLSFVDDGLAIGGTIVLVGGAGSAGGSAGLGEQSCSAIWLWAASAWSRLPADAAAGCDADRNSGIHRIVQFGSQLVVAGASSVRAERVADKDVDAAIWTASPPFP